MKLNPKQVEAVLALPAEERYKHFLKQVADSEEVWGLFEDGWALAEADDGTRVFPFWPAEDYAELCSRDEWSGYKPEPIALQDFLNELLPQLKRDNVLPGIFYTPADTGITPHIDQLTHDLHEELRNYE